METKLDFVDIALSPDECELFLNHIGHTDSPHETDLDTLSLLHDIYGIWRVYQMNTERRARKPIPTLQLTLHKVDILHRYVHPVTFGARCNQMRLRLAHAYQKLLYGDDVDDDLDLVASEVINEYDLAIRRRVYAVYPEDVEEE